MRRLFLFLLVLATVSMSGCAAMQTAGDFLLSVPGAITPKVSGCVGNSMLFGKFAGKCVSVGASLEISDSE